MFGTRAIMMPVVDPEVTHGGGGRRVFKK